MRVYLQYFAPGQQQRLTDGVIQVLHGAGRCPEDWIVLKGTPTNRARDRNRGGRRDHGYHPAEAA